MKRMNSRDFPIDSKVLDALKRAGDIFVNEARYRAEKIHPQSLLTLYGWTGIWNSLNTVQKMKVFRFVYKVENAALIGWEGEKDSLYIDDPLF
jgi:hypothetical protein